MGDGNYTTRLTYEFLREVAPDDTVARERVLLYDFVTGRAELCRRHLEGLERHVVPRLAASAEPCSVWIGGLASRRGDATLNRSLGWARACNVERYLLRRAPGLGGLGGTHNLRTTWHGERYSAHQTENSEYYRSVLVVLTRAPRYVAPSDPAPRQPHASNRFRIRYDWGYDGGEILAAGSSTFVIDYELGPGAPTSAPVYYRFLGGGFGGGLPIGGGVGDPAAAWNSFVSQRVTTPRRFGGLARLTSRSAFNSGHTVLRLMPFETDEEIVIDPFENPGGTTIALGVSTLMGGFWPDWTYTEERRAGRR